MNLIDVYSCETESIPLLFRLLQEREPYESISHKAMPHYDQHSAFVRSKPYAAWYLIDVDGQHVGATYLSRQREIGISIFRRHRGNGYATQAVKLLMSRHPGTFLANINPANQKSINFFGKLGFVHIQNTYAL